MSTRRVIFILRFTVDNHEEAVKKYNLTDQSMKKTDEYEVMDFTVTEHNFYLLA